MSSTCAQHRALLVAYVRRELPPLDERHVAAHLGNCDACAGVEASLSAGLEEARSFEPQLSAEHLDELVASVTPFIPPSQRRSPWPALAVGALSLAGAAAVAMVLLVRPPPPIVVPAPLAVAPVAPVAPVRVAPAAPEVERTTPTPHVHMVSGGGWDGVVTVDGVQTRIRATRGYAVFHFEGGAGRKLRVEAPGAVIDVVGTRFFVEAASERTLVGVAAGKVRVTAGGTTHLLAAGESGSFGAGGRRVAAAAASASWLDDPYLLDAEARAPRRGLHKSRAVLRRELDQRVAPSEPDPSAGEVLGQLQRAEDLEARGEFKSAEAILRGIVTDPRPSYEPFRDLGRYEIARLEGFRYGHVEAARASLKKLAERAGGEVGRQATLALCELDLKTDPCRSRACLMQLLLGADFEIGQEAEQLLDHWRLRGAACEQE
jgi:hypothetical protein